MQSRQVICSLLAGGHDIHRQLKAVACRLSNFAREHSSLVLRKLFFQSFVALRKFFTAAFSEGKDGLNGLRLVFVSGCHEDHSGYSRVDRAPFQVAFVCDLFVHIVCFVDCCGLQVQTVGKFPYSLVTLLYGLVPSGERGAFRPSFQLFGTVLHNSRKSEIAQVGIQFTADPVRCVVTVVKVAPLRCLVNN